VARVISLRQVWTILVLFISIVPVILMMSWYGQQLYSNQLSSALAIERQANALLRYQIESEIKRFKTLLKNKSDPLSLLVDKKDEPGALSDISALLKFIVDREPAIHEVMILSPQADVIAVIDPGIDMEGDRLLSTKEKQLALQHWGLAGPYEYPETVIPLLGREYLGSPRKHEGVMAFSMAVPIGYPAKAVLLVLINIDRLWPDYELKKTAINKISTQNYILDRRGSLITEIDGSDYSPGDFMTHMAIVRSALMNTEWSAEISYTGISKQPVFGTRTSISSLGWTLISEVMVSRLTQPIWRALFKIFIVTILVVILFVWFALYLVRKTLKPIQQTCDAIDQVAKGEYQFTLSSSGIREFDALSSGFNHMARARLSAENSLREREQNLEITLNSIGDAVIATDAKGLVTRMNPVAEQLTGWSFIEAQGQALKNIFPVINATSRESVENPIDKVINNGQTVSFSNHTVLIARDGTEYHIADSGAPIRNDDGHIVGMVLVFNDVTERKCSEEAIRRSEKRLANAQRMAHIGSWEFNHNTSELKWSEEIYRIFGIFPHESEVSYETFLSAVHPDDHEKVNRAYTESMKSKALYNIKHRLRMPDGSIKYVQERCKTYYGKDGLPTLSTGTVQDITEQYLAERALKKLNQSLQVLSARNEALVQLTDETALLNEICRIVVKIAGYHMAWVGFAEYDKEKTIRPVAEAGYEKGYIDSLNLTWADSERGQSPTGVAIRTGKSSCMSNIVQNPDFAPWREMALKQGYRSSIALPLKGRECTFGALNVYACEENAFDDEETRHLQELADSLAYGIVALRSHEDRHQLNRQLQQSQKMDALGKLTGGIAHDFNNMLGVVQGYAGLLEDALDKQPELAAYVHEIFHASERSAKLTKKLLAFSQQKNPEAKVLNLNALLQSEKNMLEKSLTARIRLILDLEKNLWTVWLDSSDLEDAILNISINAMHAIDGHGQLSIKTVNKKINTLDGYEVNIPAGDYVLLSMTDTGCGMDEATKEKIFDPFFSTKGEKGTGLGLSQVYGFVERSGGVIRVVSELGQGTQMVFYFPRYQLSHQDNKPAENSSVKNIRGNAIILVVDDEPALLKLTSKVLSKQGYKVFSAENGRQALDMLEHESIDLLLSDIIMPEMDGYELATIVQEKYPDIKIQLMSGFSDGRHVKMADDSLHQKMIYKPYNSEVLIERINNLLN